MALSEFLWFVAVALGPVVLGAAAAYALLRRRRPSSPERVVSRVATKELNRKGS